MITAAGITERHDGFQFVRPSRAPYWTLGLHLEGVNDKTVCGQVVTRRAPCIALTKPEISYQVATDPAHPDYLEYWVLFVPGSGWERLLDWPEEPPGAFHLPLDEPETRRSIIGAFEELLGFRKSLHHEKEALAENALERILLFMQELHHPQQPWCSDERVKQAMEYLRTHSLDRPSLEDTARHVHLSASRLSHLFAEKVGVSPMWYLETQRIEAAKSLLLSTNEPVYAIADRVGFGNPYHFSTRFRRHVGVPPRAFREGSGHPTRPSD